MHSVTLSVRLPFALAERLAKHAERERRSRNQVIVLALEAYLRQRGRKGEDRR